MKSRFLPVFYIIFLNDQASCFSRYRFLEAILRRSLGDFLVGYFCVWALWCHIPVAKDWFWFSYFSCSGIKHTKSSASNCLYSYLPPPFTRTLFLYSPCVVFFPPEWKVLPIRIGTYSIFYRLNICVPPTLMLKP